MMQAVSSGVSAATRSAMSSLPSPPRASTSSQAAQIDRARRGRRRLDRDDRAHARHLLGGGEHPRGQRRGRDDHRPRAAVAEDVAVVLDRVGRIGRDGDRAGAHDREVGDDPFRPVLRDQRDPVARLDAERAQAARQPASPARAASRPGQRPVAAVALGPQERPVAAPLAPPRRTSPAGCGSSRNPSSVLFPVVCSRVARSRGWRRRGRALISGAAHDHSGIDRGRGSDALGTQADRGGRRAAKRRSGRCRNGIWPTSIPAATAPSWPRDLAGARRRRGGLPGALSRAGSPSCRAPSSARRSRTTSGCRKPPAGS